MVDEVLNYNLPPSTKLNYEEVLAVVNAIAGFRCIDMRHLCNHLFNHLKLLQQRQPDASFFKWALQKQYDQTLDLGDKEASGRVLLGLFMNIVTERLSVKYPNNRLYIDHEYRVLEGKKFCTDEAIVALTNIVAGEAVFVLEYKPKVAPDLGKWKSRIWENPDAKTETETNPEVDRLTGSVTGSDTGSVLFYFCFLLLAFFFFFFQGQPTNSMG